MSWCIGNKTMNFISHLRIVLAAETSSLFEVSQKVGLTATSESTFSFCFCWWYWLFGSIIGFVQNFDYSNDGYLRCGWVCDFLFPSEPSLHHPGSDIRLEIQSGMLGICFSCSGQTLNSSSLTALCTLSYGGGYCSFECVDLISASPFDSTLIHGWKFTQCNALIITRNLFSRR